MKVNISYRRNFSDSDTSYSFQFVSPYYVCPVDISFIRPDRFSKYQRILIVFNYDYSSSRYVIPYDLDTASLLLSAPICELRSFLRDVRRTVKPTRLS